jgi:hypothetical protein
MKLSQSVYAALRSFASAGVATIALDRPAQAGLWRPVFFSSTPLRTAAPTQPSTNTSADRSPGDRDGQRHRFLGALLQLMKKGAEITSP